MKYVIVPITFESYNELVGELNSLDDYEIVTLLKWDYDSKNVETIDFLCIEKKISNHTIILITLYSFLIIALVMFYLIMQRL